VPPHPTPLVTITLPPLGSGGLVAGSRQDWMTWGGMHSTPARRHRGMASRPRSPTNRRARSRSSPLASQLLRPGSSHAQDFNTFCMHAMASDPRALRMLLHASGLALDVPVPRIVHDGWCNLVPAVQYNLAVEVLAPAWLARTAPDFSDPAIWSGGRPG